MTYEFDFYNYAGIDRPVKLVTRPKLIAIDDIDVLTDLTLDLSTALVQVDVKYVVGPDGQFESLFFFGTRLETRS